MFEAMAGAIMAAKVHCTQLQYPIIKRQDKVISETIYHNKVDKKYEKDKYKKSKMPESGYMTVEEYENVSKPNTKKEISAKILKDAEFVKDENMVYVPQHNFKLIKYNDPAGSPELSLPRKLNFDRQINAQGIVDGSFTKLVYPAVYYYAQSDCTSCDLFVINLDNSLSNLDKVKKANIINRDPEPILSTSKDIYDKFIFRTLTPIDFSKDNTKLVIKEKIGHRHDGIWKTELWVYDFEQRKAIQLPEIREAIVNYWQETEGINFDEKRWDIYPLGFDANDDERIVVNAYAYTGDIPKFLGTWSIDLEGTNSKLENLTGAYVPVAIIGYRMVEDENVKPISEVKFEAKQAKQESKKIEKEEKAEKKLEKTQHKVEYNRKIQQMNMDTMMKIENHRKELKQNKTKSIDGITGD